MKMAVFVYDRTRGLVKIVERKGIFYVYRIKSIIEEFSWCRTSKYKFIWEKKYSNKYSYEPFDENEVSYDAEQFIDSVKKFNNHIIRRV